MNKINNFALIVGSIALDTIETPHGSHVDLLGGSTTYALLAAGRFIPVHIVGVVGEDFPKYFREIYNSFAADITDLMTETGTTFRWGGKYGENQDNRETLFTELGVFADFNPQLSVQNQTAEMVFLANIHPSLQLSVMDQAGDQSIYVVDTMNLWIDTTRPELEKVLERTTFLLINESEAEMLTNETNLEKSAEILQEMGPKAVVIKQGSKGSTFFSGSQQISMGVYPVKKVVDATGAGDTFGGGFVAALAMGKDYREALALGSALASFTVEDFGVLSLLSATPETIESRLTALLNSK